jgi:uncharacterized protein (TIGR02284 family)
MPPAFPICSSSARRVSAIDSPPSVNDGGEQTTIRDQQPQFFATARASAGAFERSSPNDPHISGEMTMAEHSDTISTLNTLIATTIDSITGYEDSAQNIDNERFREIFRQRANERQQVVESLRTEVRRLGGNPEDDGSFLGKTHQRFEDLKAAVTGRDEKAIINEVERGEDYLKDKFETALDGDTLSGDSRAVVERCYQSVRSGHDQMSQLKHGMESPSNA